MFPVLTVAASDVAVITAAAAALIHVSGVHRCCSSCCFFSPSFSGWFAGAHGCRSPTCSGDHDVLCGDRSLPGRSPCAVARSRPICLPHNDAGCDHAGVDVVLCSFLFSSPSPCPSPSLIHFVTSAGDTGNIDCALLRSSQPCFCSSR
jgi:hypothetical protein